MQILDDNLYIWLKNTVSWWGDCLPFTFVAAGLLVYSVALLIKRTIRDVPLAVCVMIGSACLFWSNFQSSTYLFLRSAKMITPPVCLLLIIYFCKHLEELVSSKNKWRYFLLAFIYFVLSTLDEQVLATEAFILGISILYAFIKRKLNSNIFVFLGALGIYITYHLFWGKWLFTYYTGELSPHPHQISQIFTQFSYDKIEIAVSILYFTISNIFGIGLVALILYIFSCARYESLKELLIPLSIGIFSLVLIIFLLEAHPPIGICKDLWNSYYVMPSMLLFFASFMMIISKAEFHNGITLQFVLIWIFLAANGGKNLVDNAGNFLATNGGHMGVVMEMQVMDNGVGFYSVFASNYQLYLEQSISEKSALSFMYANGFGNLQEPGNLSSWRNCNENAVLIVDNRSGTPVTATMSFEAKSESEKGGNLIVNSDFFLQNNLISKDKKCYAMEIPLDSGKNYITFSTDALGVEREGEMVFFYIANLGIE